MFPSMSRTTSSFYSSLPFPESNCQPPPRLNRPSGFPFLPKTSFLLWSFCLLPPGPACSFNIQDSDGAPFCFLHPNTKLVLWLLRPLAPASICMSYWAWASMPIVGLTYSSRAALLWPCRPLLPAGPSAPKSPLSCMLGYPCKIPPQLC